ncbi:MAG: hypothetical protein ACR2I0_08930 [Rhodoferax sp.]
MNIALLVGQSTLAPLGILARWWHSRHLAAPVHPPLRTPIHSSLRTPVRAPHTSSHLHISKAALVPLASPAPCLQKSANLPPADSFKPLRVLRIVEQGESHLSSGRLLISGRMADVCAELDRLAALQN